MTLPDEVVRETRRKYEEAADLLMGTGESVIDGRKSSGSGDERKILSDRSTGVMQDQPKSGESEVHGKKGLIADETGLQTDQVADAIEDETGKLF